MPLHLRLLAILVLLTVSQSSFAQRIFWNEPNNSRIRFGTLSPTTITTPTIHLSGNPLIQNIALDPNHLLFFFTENNGNSLWQSNYDGSGKSELEIYGAMSEGTDIAYSANANGIYSTINFEAGGITFTPETSGGLTSLNLDGKSNDTFLSIAVDDGSERIYFYDMDDDAIYYSSFADDGVSPPIASGTGEVYTMDFDESVNRLAYASSNRLFVCDWNGANSLEIANAPGDITGVAYYAAYDRVYFVCNNAIWYATTDGLNMQSILSLAGTGVSDIGIEPDQTFPTVSSQYPADGQTDITAGSVFSLDFTEAVRISSDAGTGTQVQVRVIRTSDNAVIDALDRTDPRISISGASVLISGLTFADGLINYHILIGNRVFEDLAGNNYTGITLATDWNFTSAIDQTKFYSIKSGSWHDPTTWSHESHSGAAASTIPGSAADVEIGPGHTVTMLDDASFFANTTGFVIQTGGALDMQSRSLGLVGGELRINGTLLNGGNLSGSFDLYAANLPIFQQLLPGTMASVGREIILHSNVVSYVAPSPINGGLINTNGFEVCTPPTIPVSPVVTNINSASINLAWTPGAGEAFILIRDEGNSSTQPKFEMTYTSNANFGTGTNVGNSNFSLYQGTANNVTVTGLSPSTSYVVDMYGFNTSIGGCYSLNNYQTWNFITCPALTAPTTPVNATYCVGDTKPAILVDDPGAGRNIDWYDAATGGNLVTGNTSGGNARGEVFVPGAASGTFYAQVVDGISGCASTTRTAVTLTMNPAIVPGTASANQNICSGGTPTVLNGGTATGGTGSYTYQWMVSSTPGGPYNALMGETNATYTPLAGATQSQYYVRTVISSVCSKDGSEIAVNVVTAPTITADPVAKIVCTGEPASFRVLATGTTLTYQWQLDNGSGFINLTNTGVYSGATASVLNINDATGLNGGRYQCIVTESATCPVTSKPALLTVNTRPAAIDIPIEVCEISAGSGGANINLLDYNDEVTGGDATSNVIWYEASDYLTPVGAPNAVFTSNGRTYYPRVFGANTCTDDAVLTVTVKYKPEVTPAPQDVTICSGTATNLTFTSIPNGATYTWAVGANSSVSGASNGNGSSIVHILNNSASTQQKITYTITPELNGCQGPNFSQNVFIDPIPTIFNVTGGGSYCAGGTGVEVKLSGSQLGVKYLLFKDNVATGATSDGSNGSITFSGVTQAGVYTIHATTAANCNGNMNGSAIVSIATTPTGTPVIAGSPQFCIGQEQTYTVSGIANATSYTWTLPSGSEAVAPSTTSTITIRAIEAISGPIKVTPSNTCGAGTSSTIGSLSLSSLPQPTVEIIVPEEIFAAESATFTYLTSASVQSQAWDFGDGQSSSDEAGVNTYAAGGDYTVSIAVTASNGCTGSASVEVTVKPVASLGDISIKNVVTANGDQLNDQLYIEFLEKFPNNEVVVIDRWGAEVFRQKGYDNTWDFKKGGQYLPAGNYVCILKSEGKTYSRVVTVIK